MPARKLRQAVRCQAEAGSFPESSTEPGSLEVVTTCLPVQEEETGATSMQLMGTSQRGQEEADTPHTLVQEEEKAEPGMDHPLRLGSQFFDRPCVELARALLGQVLARRLPGGSREVLRARIVETEAYLGGEDAASHSRGGRQTVRNTAMFMAPGTLYVYQIYGVYFCMNVSSQGAGAAVLLRALEPLKGHSTMRRARLKAGGSGKPLRDWELCNGPSKLCRALHIDKSFDRLDLASDPAAWLEPGPETPEANIVSDARIGISPSAGDWVAKPLRFYVRGNRNVSVQSRAAKIGAQPPGS